MIKHFSLVAFEPIKLTLSFACKLETIINILLLFSWILNFVNALVFDLRLSSFCLLSQSNCDDFCLVRLNRQNEKCCVDIFFKLIFTDDVLERNVIDNFTWRMNRFINENKMKTRLVVCRWLLLQVDEWSVEPFS